MMRTVGLTGGMGSGKTTVGKIFTTLGIPVFNADEEAKQLYNIDDSLRQKLIELLGPAIYEGKQLQRKVMAAKIFADEILLQQVNKLVHPLLADYFKHFAQQQQAPYVILEAAILFESGLNKNTTTTVAVTAPETIRITRLLQRDDSTEKAIRERMQHQWTDDKRNAASDFVIVNDNKQAVLPQVMTIHEKLIRNDAA